MLILKINFDAANWLITCAALSLLSMYKMQSLFSETCPLKLLLYSCQYMCHFSVFLEKQYMLVEPIMMDALVKKQLGAGGNSSLL